MRLITIADVHGNIEALKSVVNDAISTYGNQINAFVFLGDYCCDFLEGEECVSLMKKLEEKYSVIAISGNRETGMVNKYKEYQDKKVEIPWNIDSTMGAPLLSCKRMSRETIDYLSSLPEYAMITFNNCAPIYLQHKMPLTEDVMKQLKKQDVHYILTGHTHEKHEGQYGDFMMFNPGACGLTDEGIPGADYGVMTWKNEKWNQEVRHVDYNYKKAIENVKSNEILMNHCKHWGNILIASIETGVNVASLYMFEKNLLAKQYYENKKATGNENISFGIGRYGNVSPINTYLEEKEFIANRYGQVSENGKNFRTESFLTDTKQVLPEEDWMYDMALANVIKKVYELKEKKQLEYEVHTGRRISA